MPTDLKTDALEMAESQHHYEGYVCLSDEDYAAALCRAQAKALEPYAVEHCCQCHSTGKTWMVKWQGDPSKYESGDLCPHRDVEVECAACHGIKQQVAALIKAAEELES